MNRMRLVSTLALGLAWSLSAAAFAQPASAPASAPNLDPRAETVFKKMSAFVAQQKNLTFAVNMSVQITTPDKKMDLEQSWEVFIQRPNHLAIVLTSKEPKAFSTYYDGKEITFFLPGNKKFLTEKTEGTVDEILKKFRPMLSQYQFIDLLKTDIQQGLLEDASSGKLGTITKIEDVEAQELSFTQQHGNWSVWVETGDKPWPRKLATVLTSPDGKSKMTLTVLLNKWTAPAEIPESTFTFKAPEGATKAEPNQPESSPADSLLNQPAPDFKLAVMGGGELELSKLKGKVVILDFWATWCPPCRKGLPVLSEVAEAFKDKNVVFYAVNEQEDEKTIQGFLDKVKLKLTVALDSEGKVGSLYKAETIPQTVIIDKDGKVARVHIGMSPDMKDELTKDVEDALAGKAPAPTSEKK